jgi:aminopeptidase 2
MPPVIPIRQILPQNVKPKHYRLSIEPDLDNYSYKGTVSIDLDVYETSNSVTLNCLDIEVHEAFIISDQGSRIPVIRISHDTPRYQSTFEFESTLGKGSKVSINLAFTGTLNDKMAGFYRSVSTDENGKKQIVATTQMAPADCRRAFPSFDEPALKASFDITLIADPKYIALSNMDIKSERILENGRKETAFNTTPLMSTYLVAFIVGEFDVVEYTKCRIPVRVYAPKGMGDRCRYSAELGAKTIDFFEKKFDVPYPLPKMDMVGVQELSFGAMENWGLITYRLVDLLLDEKKDNATAKQRVAEVVQHEIAHQWFGNYVTMNWWEGIWLNEGFATWMSWYSCNHFYPEWKVWESYVGTVLQAALSLDSLRSSHPVEVPVSSADEVTETFDKISYEKGSCIVKMVATYLGEDTFLKGITKYLKRHAYGNATTHDLWQALGEVSNIDVTSLMSAWTSEIGYPVLTVTESGSKVKVQQHRYLTTGDVNCEEDEIIYPLSLALRTTSGVDSSLMLNSREKEFVVEDSNEFYKINADQAGFYRVVYPPERVVKLSKASNLLSIEDKIGVIADATSLSTSGHQKTSSLLDLVGEWKSETEPNILLGILKSLALLQQTFRYENKEMRNSLSHVIRDVASLKLKEYGLVFATDESLLQQKLKASLYRAAIINGDQEYIDDSLAKFKLLVSGDETEFDPNLRDGVFAAAGKYGSEQDWEDLLVLYKRPAKSFDSLQALMSVGMNPNIELKKKILSHILDGTIMPQDSTYALAGLVEDNDGASLTWNWFKENYEALQAKFPPLLPMLSAVIEFASGLPHTKEKLDDFNQFFEGKDLSGIERAINVTRDDSKAKLAWAARDHDDVASWLQQHNYS